MDKLTIAELLTLLGEKEAFIYQLQKHVAALTKELDVLKKSGTVVAAP